MFSYILYSLPLAQNFLPQNFLSHLFSPCLFPSGLLAHYLTIRRQKEIGQPPLSELGDLVGGGGTLPPLPDGDHPPSTDPLAQLGKNLFCWGSQISFCCSLT